MGILESIDARLERIERRLAKCDAPLPSGGEWVDQQKSPLGRRRHCAAVRRMKAEGDARVFVRGRRHLMAPEALAEELARLSLESPAGAAGASANDAQADEAGTGVYGRALQKALAAGGSR